MLVWGVVSAMLATVAAEAIPDAVRDERVSNAAMRSRLVRIRMKDMGPPGIAICNDQNVL
jgi:hypothetical protein